MHLHDKVLAGIRSFALAKLAAQVISWGGMIYTVRQLDSAAFGTFGLASVVLSYGAMVFEGGVMEAIIQHPPASRQERRSLFTVLMGLAVALTLLMLAVAVPLGRWFGDVDVAAVLIALSVTLIFNGFTMLPLAELMRRMQFHSLAVISSIQAVVAACTTVAMAYAGYGVWALVGGAVAGAALRVALLNAACSGWERPTWSIAPAFRYARFAGTLVLDNLLFRWYTTVDTLLLGRFSGTTLLGYYTLAQDVANMPLEKVASVVNDVSLPAYSELQTDRRKAAHLMLETVRTHATIGFPLFWGMAAVATPAVLMLFGAKWAPAAVPLMALAFVGPFRLIGSVETPLLTGLGRPDVLLKTKLVLVPCMTLALAVGAKTNGLIGASLAWVTVFPVVYALCFRWVLTHVDVSFGQLLRTVGGPCTAALSMALVVLGCDLLVLSRETAPAVRLVVGIALGGVSYPLMLRLLDRLAFELLRERLLRLVGLPAAPRVAAD